MVKLIAIGVLLALIGWGITTALSAAYQSGVDAELTRQSNALAAEQTAEQAEIKKLNDWLIEARKNNRDDVQKIHTAADPTGCLDTDLRDAGLGFMLPAARSH